ncbi:MAG: sel1 repeat family protein [Phycisphaerae bacterium]|nr:sel1 repeat family protein [Phycisphaerae bacterium]
MAEKLLLADISRALEQRKHVFMPHLPPEARDTVHTTIPVVAGDVTYLLELEVRVSRDNEDVSRCTAAGFPLSLIGGLHSWSDGVDTALAYLYEKIVQPQLSSAEAPASIRMRLTCDQGLTADQSFSLPLALAVTAVLFDEELPPTTAATGAIDRNGLIERSGAAIREKVRALALERPWTREFLVPTGSLEEAEESFRMEELKVRVVPITNLTDAFSHLGWRLKHHPKTQAAQPGLPLYPPRAIPDAWPKPGASPGEAPVSDLAERGAIPAKVGGLVCDDQMRRSRSAESERRTSTGSPLSRSLVDKGGPDGRLAFASFVKGRVKRILRSWYVVLLAIVALLAPYFFYQHVVRRYMARSKNPASRASVHVAQEEAPYPEMTTAAYSDSTSPLRTTDGVWLEWNGLKPKQEIGSDVPPARGNLTQGGKVNGAVAHLFYDGTAASREFFLIVRDRKGYTSAQQIVVERALWKPLEIDLTRLQEAGIDARDIDYLGLRVANIKREERGSLFVVGLLDPWLMPSYAVAPRLWLTTPSRQEMRGVIRVVPNLRKIAGAAEKASVGVFCGPPGFEFRCLFERHFSGPPPFPLDIDLSCGGRTRCKTDEVGVIAVFKVGNKALVGQSVGGASSETLAITLDRVSKEGTAPLPRREELRFQGGSALEAATGEVSAEALEARCTSKDTSACHQIGLRYMNGVGVMQSSERAASLWRTGCLAGNLDACNSLGVLYADGNGARQDDNKAAELFVKACNGGVATACGNLGTYQSATGLEKKHPETTMTLYRKGCEGGDPASCLYLGVRYAKGLALDANHELAIEALRKACERGEPAGCTRLGHLYLESAPGIANSSTGAAYMRQGCGGGDAEGCCALGLLYDRGIGVARDFHRAEHLFLLGCDGRSGCACNNLGRLYEDGRYGIPADEGKSLQYFERSCDLRSSVGCTNLARKLVELPGNDLERAAKAASRACDQKDPLGCHALAEVALRMSDRKRATRLFRQSCRMGDSEACRRAKHPESPGTIPFGGTIRSQEISSTVGLAPSRRTQR